MKTLKRNIFLLLFLTISSTCLAGIGLADWSRITPGHNEINNFYGGSAIYFSKGTELDSLERWYFYKGHIVGELTGKGFFVANELTSEVVRFSDKSSWKNYIESANLEPKVWTRWYDTDWNFFQALPYLLWLPFFGIIPLIWIYAIILIRAIKRERFNLKKPYTIMTISIPLLVVLLNVANNFPQSFWSGAQHGLYATLWQRLPYLLQSAPH